MATWRVARSLDTLLGQLNAAAPRRSKLSDGSIGDAAHASRSSDHNPYIKLAGTGIVTARDYTHDPVGGLDCNWLAQQLVASGDPRIKYVIWNRRIWSPSRGWVAYKGTNPHDKHLHLSVSEQPGWFDSTRPWALTGSGPTTSPVTTLPVAPADPGGLFMSLSEAEERRILKFVDDWGYLLPTVKGNTDYLPNMASAVGEIRWGVLDPEQGLRVQLSALFARVSQGSGTGITPGDIAAMIPADLARQVADELHSRLAS